MLQKCLYLVVRQSDRCIKHGPQDALVAGRSGEGALVSEEMVEVLGEHRAHVDARYVHGLACQGQMRVTLFESNSIQTQLRPQRHTQ